MKLMQKQYMTPTTSSEVPFYSAWQQEHQIINRLSKYIHCLKSRLALNAKVEHLSQLACPKQINESLTGTEEMFSLAKHSMTNVFLVEAGSNYFIR